MIFYEDMTIPEREVAAFLKELGLWWEFEHPIYVLDDKERPRLWTPDFYLPQFGVYIEVCGRKRQQYKFREKMYHKNNYRVIFLHYYKGEALWKRFLIDYIKDTQNNRNEILNSINNNFNA
jgi:hypothetical protein